MIKYLETVKEEGEQNCGNCFYAFHLIGAVQGCNYGGKSWPGLWMSYPTCRKYIRDWGSKEKIKGVG